MTATQPGVGRLLADDLRARDVHVEGIESDGRSDLVISASAEPPPEETLVLAEDLFIVVGDAPAATSANAVAARLFDAARWQRAADVARSFGARIGATTGFRVIVRVRSERHFKRTELRAAIAGAVQQWRPRWKLRDPADLELWVLETRRGHFRAAMRLSSAEMRAHGGRAVERPGALRPSVAAALVRCAGSPSGRLLDPFCGSGTVLIEAARAGWEIVGFDINEAAVRATRDNVPAVEVAVADAARLPLANAAVGAVATNAPFGVQHVPQTGGREIGQWWSAILGELVRVVRPGGPIVILHPEDRELTHGVRATAGLVDTGHVPIRTLGVDAAIWNLRRR